MLSANEICLYSLFDMAWFLNKCTKIQWTFINKYIPHWRRCVVDKTFRFVTYRSVVMCPFFYLIFLSYRMTDIISRSTTHSFSWLLQCQCVSHHFRLSIVHILTYVGWIRKMNRWINKDGIGWIMDAWWKWMGIKWNCWKIVSWMSKKGVEPN
jgi:hypothetical protein